MIGGYSKLSFFQYEYWVGHLWKVSRDFFRYLKLSEIVAETRNYFILKPQVNCRNISAVNQQWAKLSYFIKTQWFDGVWKVWNDSDSIWWLSGWRQLIQTRPLKANISEILETLDKDYHDWWLLQTKFFNNEYWVGHLWKVSRDFFRYLKLSEIVAETRNYFILKPQVNCRNISAVNQQWAKLSYFIKTQWFDGVWKVSNDSDSIWWLSGWRQLIQRRLLKAI